MLLLDKSYQQFQIDDHHQLELYNNQYFFLLIIIVVMMDLGIII